MCVNVTLPGPNNHIWVCSPNRSQRTQPSHRTVGPTYQYQYQHQYQYQYWRGHGWVFSVGWFCQTAQVYNRRVGQGTECGTHGAELTTSDGEISSVPCNVTCGNFQTWRTVLNFSRNFFAVVGCVSPRSFSVGAVGSRSVLAPFLLYGPD